MISGAQPPDRSGDPVHRPTSADAIGAEPVHTPFPFPIVGIGASAGGLKALTSLLAGIPDGTGMGFVVIQHLDPSHTSQLPGLLAKGSRLLVEEAVDGVAVRPDRVYVITANTRIAIEGGILRVSPRKSGPAPHLAINAFLLSLATDRPGCAIGIILSGTGSDGTLGLAAIKAAGGVTFAQDDTATFAGMPQSAIEHGHVDFVLEPGAIGTELGRIARAGFPCLPKPAAPDPGTDGSDLAGTDAAGVDPVAYARIIVLLHAATGIDFTHYRSTTVMRRTTRRMAMASLATLAAYAAHLAATPIEVDALARDVLIHVTSFFRDPAAFASLTANVFPAIAKGRSPDAPIRVWVVGCSTGQEVYSLAMELLEYLQGISSNQRVQIFATDISEWALARARAGSYPDSIADEIPPARLARYFAKDASGYKVAKWMRDLCVFAKHDVTADIPFSQLDLISCRNVLIYLGPVLHDYVLPTFHFSLKLGGFLLLGASESLGAAATMYQTVDDRNRIYRSIAAPGRTRPMPRSQQRPWYPGAAPSGPSSASTGSDMQRAADQIVLGRFAPAGVLVTEALEIIQFRGRTNSYLQPAQGEANLNLLSMVPFTVAESLRDALNDAKIRNLTVRHERVLHRRDQVAREIAFEMIPIKLPSNAMSFLVLFEEQDARATPAAAPQSPPETGAHASDRDAQEVRQLRAELLAATDYVHSLAEGNHELAERLQDAQVEVQSGSEEFRSTNEELQTAKEEIESTNQELVTLNDQLRMTNQGLAKTSADLRTAWELTSTIVDRIPAPLLVLSGRLHVEIVNEAFLAMFGVGREETVGRLAFDLSDGQWDIPELRQLLDGIAHDRPASDRVEATREFDRIGRKTVLFSARLLDAEDGESRLILLTIEDITERRRIVADLQDESDELQRSNSELDKFASIASHDMQEPLRMMTNFISLLEAKYRHLFDDRAREYMAQVSGGAQRLREMIDSILAFSRVGYDADDVQVIDSGVPFRHALANLSLRIANAQATIIDGPLPRVSANLEQATQLFQNLVNNGIKFRSNDRLPVIRVGAEESATEWTFSVADNGIGIRAEDFTRIFQLFQRVHADRSVPGSGIGLATCKKIVEHHHGRIWLASTADVGTTFYFTCRSDAPPTIPGAAWWNASRWRAAGIPRTRMLQPVADAATLLQSANWRPEPGTRTLSGMKKAAITTDSLPTVFHLVPVELGYQLKWNGPGSTFKTFPTARDAVEAACLLAKQHIPSQVRLYGEHGTSLKAWTFAAPPLVPAGEPLVGAIAE